MEQAKVIAVIMGGGAGTRLYPLTSYRAKPAVPIAGKYRLVAACWLIRTKAAFTNPCTSASCSMLSRKPKCRSASLSNFGSVLA